MISICHHILAQFNSIQGTQNGKPHGPTETNGSGPVASIHILAVTHHILAVTHRILSADGSEEQRRASLNVYHMNKEINSKKRGKGRPKPLKSCLQLESSDEEEEGGVRGKPSGSS